MQVIHVIRDRSLFWLQYFARLVLRVFSSWHIAVLPTYLRTMNDTVRAHLTKTFGVCRDTVLILPAATFVVYE